MVSTLLLFLLFQQAGTTHHPVNVKAFEDIEIGMPENSVIGSLVQAGYTVSMPKPPLPGNIGRGVVDSSGKEVGIFFVDEDGRVKDATEHIYMVYGKEAGPIELAEALYWLIHDEGSAVASDGKDWAWTETDAKLTTGELITRTPAYTSKRFDIKTKSGASYIVELNRYRVGQNDSSSVKIDKIAPFPKK